MSKCKHKLNWHPDRPDFRDMVFNPNHGTLMALAVPTHVDLRPKMPPVYDQAQIGSCTGNASGGAVEFLYPAAGMPSRLFIYWCERDIEGTTKSDAGAQIRDAVKSLAKWGVCPETEWPYGEKYLFEKPVPRAYADAAKHKIAKYLRVLSLGDMKKSLAAGFPVVIGFTVYSSFESEEMAKTGVMQMPEANESVIGGHAVLVVGYDDSKQMLIVRNSWSDSWGISGYFEMPYQYITSGLASDFWTLRA